MEKNVIQPKMLQNNNNNNKKNVNQIKSWFNWNIFQVKLHKPQLVWQHEMNKSKNRWEQTNCHLSVSRCYKASTKSLGLQLSTVR